MAHQFHYSCLRDMSGVRRTDSFSHPGRRRAARSALGRANLPQIAHDRPQRPDSRTLTENLTGIVRDSLERAVQQAFARPIPKSADAQLRYLVK
ncbi:hypothetical protein GCM10010104_23840 [Streptomyces indiaensis]|uniref:Uncharacterized protein n=1 Tax=Streptomyces indiaensis TaxID=284033 RepID=A0ABN3DFW4_9ACTN